MTEHILNFTIEFDDEKIVKSIEEKAEASVIRDIRQEVLNTIFEPHWYGSKAVTVDDDGKVNIASSADLKPFVKELVRNVLEENKDEFFELATKKLIESIRQTKNGRI